MNSINFYKSWIGLNIVALGEKPDLVEKLIKAINSVVSDREIIIECFTDYYKALEFCDIKKNVPLFFIFDSCYDLPLSDILYNLSSFFTDNTGLPAAGLIVATENLNLDGYQALAKNRCFLDYIVKEDIIDHMKAVYTFDKIWLSFTYFMEARIIPDPLKLTFLSLIDKESINKSIKFLNRVTYVLLAKFSISWQEYLSLRWIHLIYEIYKLYPKALKLHKGLLKLCDNYFVDYDFRQFNIETLYSDITIRDINKIIIICRFLDYLRTHNRLKSYLDKMELNLQTHTNPIVKYLLSKADVLLSISKEVEENDVYNEDLNLLKVG